MTVELMTKPSLFSEILDYVIGKVRDAMYGERSPLYIRPV